MFPGTSECATHADCPGLEFCVSEAFGDFCAEGCQQDADCGSGYVCRCADPIGVCAAATCLTGDDCDPGSFCAGVVDPTCDAKYEYACQSAADACQTDRDCVDRELGNWCRLVEGVRRCDTLRPCH